VNRRTGRFILRSRSAGAKGRGQLPLGAVDFAVTAERFFEERLNMTTATLPIYTKKDFQTDQEIRWCPGCGDYAILAAVQAVFAELGVPREKFVFISGIGCSSRFPYYMNTFGFHTIHGRAPAIATGVKLVRPDLDVWVATGDGDSLSIGGNHTIHMLRRNVGLKVLMFNNKIYGLTKGQYSPTSEVGKKAKSTPFGSVDRPFSPLSLALGSEATFIARSVDVFQQHLKETLRKAAAHQGSAYIEILQNCNIFNDGAWETITEKEARSEQVVQLEHGKPLIFGKNRDKGIRLVGLDLEVVALGNGISEKDLLVHDEHNPNPVYAFALSRMDSMPGFPTPIGVLRALQGVPRYEDLIQQQIRDVIAKKGKGDLAKLLRAGDTWELKA
jgi:2-oxoglutarate ferredoxin oxidoreductase subunit beta